jgi:hypothetical protein
MCSTNASPSCIYSHGKISLELWEFFRNSSLAWNATTLHLGNAQESQKKMEIRTHIHTTSQFSASVDGHSCLLHPWPGSCFSLHSTAPMATKQLHAQSSDSHMFTRCFTQPVHLLHKHSFITLHLTHFNIIHCNRMFSNVTSLIIAVSFSVMRK